MVLNPKDGFRKKKKIEEKGLHFRYENAIIHIEYGNERSERRAHSSVLYE